MSERKGNHVARAADWRAAAEADRQARAERLTLPSGATILAARPEPLEWVLSGRLPQRLLTAALESDGRGRTNPTAREMTGEEIAELAEFAQRLIRSSVVAPAIGDGPDEIPMAELPAEDCAFIFEWACRALSEPRGESGRRAKESDGSPAGKEEASIPRRGIERFRSG